MAVDLKRNDDTLKNNLNNYFNSLEEGHPDKWKYDKELYDGGNEAGDKTNSRGHHLIPFKVAEKFDMFFYDLSAAGGGDFKLNGVNNGVYLPSHKDHQLRVLDESGGTKAAAVHSGNHAAYSTHVSSHLEKLSDDYSVALGNIDPDADQAAETQRIAKEYFGRVGELQYQLKNNLVSNSIDGVRLMTSSRDGIVDRRRASAGLPEFEAMTPENRSAAIRRDVFDPLENDAEYNDRMQGQNGFHTRIVEDENGNFKKQATLTSSAKQGGFADLRLVGALGTAAGVLIAASLAKKAYDYLDEEGLTQEEVIEFLASTDIGLSQEQLLAGTLTQKFA